MVRILDDFKVNPSGRSKTQLTQDPALPHKHNPIFVQSKSEFQLVNPGNNRLYEKVEYAILLCKECETVFRTVVKDLDEE